MGGGGEDEGHGQAVGGGLEGLTHERDFRKGDEAPSTMALR